MQNAQSKPEPGRGESRFRAPRGHRARVAEKFKGALGVRPVIVCDHKTSHRFGGFANYQHRTERMHTDPPRNAPSQQAAKRPVPAPAEDFYVRLEARRFAKDASAGGSSMNTIFASGQRRARTLLAPSAIPLKLASAATRASSETDGSQRKPATTALAR